MDPERERIVVAGLRRGDPDAFDEAYAACRPRVFGFLARLSGRKDLAEDLLQETFLRLAARGDRLAADTRLLPWLFTVARNLYVSDYRSRLLDADRMDQLALAGTEAATATPFEEAAGSELGRRLERAIASMPPMYREVVLLVAVERLEPSEAAVVLFLSPEAVRQRLSRARGLLQDALAEPDTNPRRARKVLGVAKGVDR